MAAVSRSLQPIPKFESEDDEREFWAAHDSTEHVDWSRPGTADQMFYAGAHLTSFQLITTMAGCSVDIEWSTSAGTGTRSLP
ncbi:MAG TPA: CopG family antitoxin [Thermoanaerobaculia bacterium]|jgi:hypothetical protein|nr:CopG family antitoxin [Thermoanaerobaculia bacterium]